MPIYYKNKQIILSCDFHSVSRNLKLSELVLNKHISQSMESLLREQVPIDELRHSRKRHTLENLEWDKMKAIGEN